jgi:ABC-type dipeptide/oligopeptide/nickel transport system permease component
MMAYLIKRFLFAIPVLLLTALLVFLALHLSPGDPVDLLVSPIAPESVRERLRTKLGLDKPLAVQFFIYMGNIAQGNLGDSIINKQPVADLIKQKLPITAELGAAAFVLAYAMAIPLGTIAALNRNSVLDWFSMIMAMIGVSMPDFWLGLILMLVFAVTLKWLPATGYGTIDKLILPVLALGLPRVGRIARITRSSVLEVVNQDYVRTARSKGIPEIIVTSLHILRNSLIPIISLMGLDLGYIVGGAVVIEHVFARPGVGDMMLQSIYSRDFPVLQGCMFVLALAIILGNILADLLYVVVDPRISHESSLK